MHFCMEGQIPINPIRRRNLNRVVKTGNFLLGKISLICNCMNILKRSLKSRQHLWLKFLTTSAMLMQLVANVDLRLFHPKVLNVQNPSHFKVQKILFLIRPCLFNLSHSVQNGYNMFKRNGKVDILYAS